MKTSRFGTVLFDWGGTLMSEDGPQDVSMGLWTEVRAIEGAYDTLATLSATHRIGIATNATVSRRDMIERALSRVSLLPFITNIFCFTEIGARKDTPVFWNTVFSTLGVGPDAIVMVGDTLDQDVVASRTFGVFSVWFNEGGRSKQQAPGVPVINRLSDIIPMV